jgi:hypothetical protein
VTADVVMRSYAESTKTAVRACTTGGEYAVDYVAPAGFEVAGAGAECPAPAVAELLTLTVSHAPPDGGPPEILTTLTIAVRTP